MISIPFSGSKRFSYKNVAPIVKENNYTSVFEPFGGSGVLSVNLLKDVLVKRAVVNDYDHFFDGYEIYLDLKDIVVSECYKRGLHKTLEDKNGYFFIDDNNQKVRVKQRTLPKKDRKILQQVISENVPYEYWRYFALGSNFTWGVIQTHEKIHIKDFTLFSRQLETTKQREYLSYLNKAEIDNLDWSDFLDKYESDIRNSNSLLILDPPYINTEQNQYKGSFTEEDTIDLLNRVKALNCDFIFFNHDQEKIKEWLNGTDFKLEITGGTCNSKRRNRKDVMAYVKNSGTH